MHPTRTRHHTIGLLGLAVGIAAAATVVADVRPAARLEQEPVRPAVSTLRIRANVTVNAETATLADVLDLADADARLVSAIGPHAATNTPIAPGGTLALTHAQIITRLDDLGVNRARLLLVGAAICRITREAPPAPAPAAAPAGTPASADAPLLGAAPPAQPAASDRAPGSTLADAVRNALRAELSTLGGEPEIAFEAASADVLALTGPPWQFTVRPAPSKSRLGLREFTVTIRSDGRVHRSVQVFANVQLSRRVLVATRPLAAGTFLRAEDMRLETRLFTRAEELGSDDPRELLGLQLVRFVEADETLSRRSVKKADLVERSRPVQIVSDHGAVRVRATGIALRGGALGDTIRVRVGENRRDQREIDAVVTGLGTVRLLDTLTSR